MLYSHTIKLVRFYDGVDGLKTGFTDEAGYCLTATAKKSNMRVIAVVMGEPDSKTRNAEVSSMLDYMYAQYDIEKLLSKNSVIGKIEVDKSKDKYVELIPMEDVTVLQHKIGEKKNATYDIKLKEIKAPVKTGDIVGELIIKENETQTRTINITVNKNVKKANFFELYWQYLTDILKGDINI